MKYLHLVNAHQQELNDFPIMWAFNDEQFIEGMKKLGLKETDTDKIVTINSGGFMKKTDAPAFNAMMKRHAQEWEEAYEDDEFLYEAFLYELGNHEFCITYEYEPTLSALGLTEDQILNDERMLKILKRAKKDYLEDIRF